MKMEFTRQLLICCIVLLPLMVHGDRTVIVEQTFKEIIKEFDNVDKSADIVPFDAFHQATPGHADNCGPKDMNLSWEPAAIDKKGSVTISLDMIAPVNFTGGTVKGKVYWGSRLVVSKTIPVDCQWINTYLPNSCPVNKSAHIKTEHKITDLSVLQRAPRGKYRFETQITNSAGELFLCAKAVVKIT